MNKQIDIMEFLGHQPNRIRGTLHYAERSGTHAFRGKDFVLANGPFADAFHLFRLDWGPAGIRWSVDGEVFHTETKWNSGANSFPAPFDQKFHLILTVAVGGLPAPVPSPRFRSPRTAPSRGIGPALTGTLVND